MKEEQTDKVIDEIREVRHRVSERCGHDPDQLVAYYIRLQEQFRERLLTGEANAKKVDEDAA